MTTKTLTVWVLMCAATLANAQNTIFWEVNDTVNHRTSYLLGTCHTIGASFIDGFDVVGHALKNSSTAIFEILDEVKADHSILQNRQKSDSLQMMLTKKEYAHLKSINPAWTDDLLQRLTPLELKFKLMNGISMRICGNYTQNDALIYLDDYLETKAKHFGLKTIGLETGIEQIEVLEKLPNKTWLAERKALKAMLKFSAKGNYDPDFCSTNKSYVNFELQYHFGEPCPDDPLLVYRNDKWMPKVIQLLSSDNCFVAVGQLHLAYDCGLIARLREQGFVVTPIPLKP